jgi:heptosyltransferase-2
VREGLDLRRRHFDLGVCLPDSFSSALLMRLAGVREVVGYARDLRRILLHRAVPLPGTPGSMEGQGGRTLLAREAHVLGLIEALGAERRGTELELFVTVAEQAEADAKLRERAVAPEAPRAILAPGASFGPSKLWPVASFARVGDALAKAGAAVVVVGTPEERGLGRALVGAMKAKAADLCGDLGLGALKGVMRGSRVLVCNDAGARHIGVALGVPSVVMMGPTALEKTNWNLERVTVFTADVHCRPCYQRECPIDHRCMTRIPADAVAEEAAGAFEAEAGSWGGRLVELPGGEEPQK